MQYRTAIMAIALSVGVAGSVLAQDRWSGFYGGLKIDVINNTSKVGNNNAHKHNSKSGLLGIFAGYNFTTRGNIVWGPEVGLAGLANETTRTSGPLGTSKAYGSYMLTPRVRAGWANDKFLVYGALGVGITNAGVVPNGVSKPGASAGLHMGLGVEMGLKNGWATRLEASTTRMKGKTYNFGGTNLKTKTKFDTITIGLSRKF